MERLDIVEDDQFNIKRGVREITGYGNAYFPFDFKKHGLKLDNEKNGNWTYKKFFNKKIYIEVFDSMGVISIDLVNNSNRITIASRYECKRQSDVDFLLTKSGRIKFIFTSS